MWLHNKVLVFATILFLSQGLYSQQYTANDLRNAIFKITAKAKGSDSRKVSTGFAFQHADKKGILLTLHALCGCDNYSATKYVWLQDGKITFSDSTVYVDFKITFADWARDIAFIESPGFEPPLTFERAGSNIDISRFDFRGYGFKGNLLDASALTLDELNSNAISLGTLLKNYDLKVNNETPIFNSKILKFDNNGVIRSGWSGGPIFLHREKELFGIINGGLVETVVVPIVFGFELSSINLQSFSAADFNTLCQETYAGLMYSGTEQERNIEAESKIDSIIGQKQFQRYYKFLYARPKRSKKDYTPETMILYADSVSADSTRDPYIVYSKKLQNIADTLIGNEKTTVSVRAVYNELEQLELVAIVGKQQIQLPYAGTTIAGYRYWKLKDYLIKVIDLGEWVKLVFLSIVAEQINEKEVKVVLFEKCPGSKKRIRKSYISYPEAKKKDLILKK